MIDYGDLPRKEKDVVIDKWNEHKKYSRMLGLPPQSWNDFRVAFTRELTRREEIQK